MRFVILVVFCLGAIANAICFLSGASIIDELGYAYSMSPFFITFSSLTFMITFFIFAFPVNYIVQRWGLRVGLMLGLIFTCLGMWTKTLIKTSPVFYLLGNTLAGIGQPFFMNTYTLVGFTWFSEKG